jgi:hypothetical protein
LQYYHTRKSIRYLPDRRPVGPRAGLDTVKTILALPVSITTGKLKSLHDLLAITSVIFLQLFFIVFSIYNPLSTIYSPLLSF